MQAETIQSQMLMASSDWTPNEHSFGFGLCIVYKISDPVHSFVRQELMVHSPWCGNKHQWIASPGNMIRQELWQLFSWERQYYDFAVIFCKDDAAFTLKKKKPSCSLLEILTDASEGYLSEVFFKRRTSSNSQIFFYLKKCFSAVDCR